eukprot:5927673-Pleurochrysis_carterae.AAC.2
MLVTPGGRWTPESREGARIHPSNCPRTAHYQRPFNALPPLKGRARCGSVVGTESFKPRTPKLVCTGHSDSFAGSVEFSVRSPDAEASVSGRAARAVAVRPRSASALRGCDCGA